jgi:formimidoylglutamate deiminase
MIFASQQNPVHDVMVNGVWHIRAGQHAQQQDASREFAELLQRLKPS